MKSVSGIYRIVCVSNGNYYYGSARNIERRWGAHKRALQQQTHYNPKVQKTWNEYGANSFRIELVEAIPIDKLSEIETVYLKEHVGKPHCMNIAIDAYSPMRGRSAGPCSEEKKEKIRNSLLGHPVSDETRKKIGLACKGKNLGPRSESKRINIAKARRPNGFPLVKSPDGTVYEIGILTDFCNQHNLHLPSMSYVVNRKKKSHRKWMLV